MRDASRATGEEAATVLQTFFVWGFIVLPLCAAIILIFFRARLFLLGVLALIVAMVLVWTAINLIDRAQRTWWPEPEATAPGCPPGETCAP
jgi:hypothetical protein